MDSTFSAELFEWRGPAPFYWLALPQTYVTTSGRKQLRPLTGGAPSSVSVRIGATEWETLPLPRNGEYVLPVKKDVRAKERFGDGDTVTVAMSVSPRGGRAANGTGPAV